MKKRVSFDSADEYERAIDRENSKIEKDAARIEAEQRRALAKFGAAPWHTESPSVAQLKYIRSLGGDIRSVSNKYEAAKLIDILKKSSSRQKTSLGSKVFVILVLILFFLLICSFFRN